MVIRRGDIVWVDLGEPSGRAPAKRRPVLIISSDAFNRSRLRTVLTAVVTSNTAMAVHPGNVFLPATVTGLSEGSVVNVTQLVTLDREDPEGQDLAGEVPSYLMTDVNAGLCLALAL